MKNKFISFGILLISFLLFTASTTSFVSDLQNLFNNQTKELVTQKNKEYQKTKNKPEIRLLSLKNSWPDAPQNFASPAKRMGKELFRVVLLQKIHIIRYIFPNFLYFIIYMMNCVLYLLNYF